MLLTAQIEQLAGPIVELKGAYIVEVAVRHEGKIKTVEIFADTDQGITTGLCADISRELSGIFDASGLFPDRYYLVVSSPGLDRPLKLERQYAKNKGRSVTLRVSGEQGEEQFRATLVEANESGIVVECENDVSRQFTYASIIEARVNAAW